MIYRGVFYDSVGDFNRDDVMPIRGWRVKDFRLVPGTAHHVHGIFVMWEREV